ncbi:hypothetical protein [Acinetobacter soli]
MIDRKLIYKVKSYHGNFLYLNSKDFSLIQSTTYKENFYPIFYYNSFNILVVQVDDAFYKIHSIDHSCKANLSHMDKSSLIEIISESKNIISVKMNGEFLSARKDSEDKSFLFKSNLNDWEKFERIFSN